MRWQESEHHPGRGGPPCHTVTRRGRVPAARVVPGALPLGLSVRGRKPHLEEATLAAGLCRCSARALPGRAGPRPAGLGRRKDLLPPQTWSREMRHETAPATPRPWTNRLLPMSYGRPAGTWPGAHGSAGPASGTASVRPLQKPVLPAPGRPASGGCPCPIAPPPGPRASCRHGPWL